MLKWYVVFLGRYFYYFKYKGFTNQLYIIQWVRHYYKHDSLLKKKWIIFLKDYIRVIKFNNANEGSLALNVHVARNYLRIKTKKLWKNLSVSLPTFFETDKLEYLK